MAAPTVPEPDEWSLIRRAADGDNGCLDKLLAHYRTRLLRMLRLRLDPRLQGRVDPADVLQQASVDLGTRLPEYVRNPERPFYLWLRELVGQKLEMAHWQQLGALAGRGVSLFRGALPGVSPTALAAQLLGRTAGPSEAATRAGLKIRIQDALNGMDALDREVLALRHFEQLSNAETAQVLGLKEAATCNRYVRALERLHGILSGSRVPSVSEPRA
jgi:RNA polymerase sigma-70 factor (ECF subfamily)